MEKRYRPEQIEQRLYREWEASGGFAPQGDGAPYCIMIPPPNITGTLHMGHAFQVTLMDCLVRYHRMRGFRTLWQAGTDHAGIAAQMVVERQLEAENVSRRDIGRERFLEKVWKWKETSGGNITQQLRRLGASLDWSRERFTMDAQLSAAVTEAFVRLYDEGIIYRGKRLVNWDPVLKTAISDLEVVSEEEDGQLWHVRYPFVEGDGHMVIATTRPETILVDGALAVHPGDERFKAVVGRKVRVPMTDRQIEIIPDDFVDPTFGSGCVKITAAHDFNDYGFYLRHPHTPMINLFTPGAVLNKNAPPRYQGLDRFEARRRIVQDLEQAGLLQQTEPHRYTLPRGDRSGSVIEPYLTDQWFMRAERLAGPARDAVRDGRIRFVPERWSKTYFEWMNQLQDWCISRQLWWGHRIPAWHGGDGNIYVGASEQAVRDRHGLPAELDLTRDPDVLDTWFSSALWPFSTLGWPQQSPGMKTFYPTSVLVTGFDIIFFWVARMIMAGMKFTGEVPFREVYVHGLVRDADGRKMSKSKGNVIDPIDLIDGIDAEDLVAKHTANLMQPKIAKRIEQDTRKHFPDGISAYGTDALRFTFTALASTGRDIKFDLHRIEGYRNFCNKLWNAARFTTMICPQAPSCTNAPPTLADWWIRSRLHRLLERVQEWFAVYRFDLAAAAMHEYVWHDFCDWYLELVKIEHGAAPDGAGKPAAPACLVETLEAVLRMLHPVIPFITEEIWQQLKPLSGASGRHLQDASYPLPDASAHDTEAEKTMAHLQSFVSAIRQLRAEMKVPPGTAVPVLLQNWQPQDRVLFDEYGDTIAALAKLERIEWLAEDAAAPTAAIALAGKAKILVPVAGLMDIRAETARLQKEIAKIGKTMEHTKARLSNREFLERAPESVVAKQRGQLEELEGRLDKYRKQLALFERGGNAE